MFCPKCGASLVDGADFCQKCGAQVKKEEEPQPQAYAQQEYVAAAAPKRSKAPIIIAVCAAVVVVIIIAAIAIPVISLRNEETQIQNIMTNIKDCRPFDGKLGQERWQTSDTPTYAEVFDYTINPTWDVTDPDDKELRVNGWVSYSLEGISLYFRGDSTSPYMIECGEKTFTKSEDITNFLYDMFDAYMTSEDFIPCTYPKFCGKYNDVRYAATVYENKYLGFKLTLPPYDSSWYFMSDDEMKNFGFTTKDSIEDLSRLYPGDYFVDAAAVNSNSSDIITISMEYEGSEKYGYTDDELIDVAIEGMYNRFDEINGGTSIQVEEELHTIGGMKCKTLLMEIYQDEIGLFYEKYYVTVKDDVLLYIIIGSADLSEFDYLETLFTAI